MGAAVWCTAWALLSKMFTRQAHFSWHLRVFLYASVGLLAISARFVAMSLTVALSPTRARSFRPIAPGEDPPV